MKMWKMWGWEGLPHLLHTQTGLWGTQAPLCLQLTLQGDCRRNTEMFRRAQP